MCLQILYQSNKVTVLSLQPTVVSESCPNIFALLMGRQIQYVRTLWMLVMMWNSFTSEVRTESIWPPRHSVTF